MVIESFKFRITSKELSDIIVRQGRGLIKTCVCRDGCLSIGGILPNGNSFSFEVAVRMEFGKLLLEVVDASVEGLCWGWQEYGVSLTIDKMLKRYFPNAGSGGRTISVVPFSDIVKRLTSLCKMQEMSLPDPALSLTRNGLEISANNKKEYAD